MKWEVVIIQELYGMAISSGVLNADGFLNSQMISLHAIKNDGQSKIGVIMEYEKIIVDFSAKFGKAAAGLYPGDVFQETYPGYTLKVIMTHECKGFLSVNYKRGIVTVRPEVRDFPALFISWLILWAIVRGSCKTSSEADLRAITFMQREAVVYFDHLFFYIMNFMDRCPNPENIARLTALCEYFYR